MIEYSIIIPHKNIPKLLQRCLDSVPLRDDLEVIVVDDNSDPNIVDFEKFPGTDRKDTIVFFDKSGRGAGRARNIGLEHAKGKWLLFADADDYFNYCIRDILDEYIGNEADIVFFSVSSVDSETYTNVGRADIFSKMIADYLEGVQFGESMLRYSLACPWGKVIRRKVVDNNSIRFQETSRCNDVKFSYLIGHNAKTIRADRRALYCVTYRSSSISNSLEESRILDEIRVEAERDAFLRKNKINLPESCFRYYRGALDKVLANGNYVLFEKCLDTLSEYGITKEEINALLNVGSNKKEYWRFFDYFKNRIALRTRIRRFCTLD